MKKKIVIPVVLAVALLVGGGAYYYFGVHRPHVAAVEEFEAASTATKEQNEPLEKASEEASKLIASGDAAYDPATLENLRSANDAAKAALIKVPKMPSATSEILDATEKLSGPVDFSSEEDALDSAMVAYENSVKQQQQITNPAESFVIERLKAIPSVTDTQAVTEENDPNGNLNKAKGYTAAVYFVDNQVTEEIEGVDIIDKGTTAGGQVEVYANAEDAETRNSYLAAFDGAGALNPGSHAVYGTLVIRTSEKLTATQQKELESQILASLIELR